MGGSLLFDLRPNYGEGNEDMATSFKNPVYALPHSVPRPCSRPQLHLCWRLLDTTSKSGSVSCGGHCSFPLGPGAHKVLFVPSKSLFFKSCVSSGSSMVGLMATFPKRAYAIPRFTASRASATAAGHCLPTPPQETLKHSSGSVSV